MDIQHLRYFLTVSRTLNYTKAAEELYISRQAVAQAVRQLETELQSPLLINRKNALALTPLGLIFQKEAAKIVRAFGQFEAAMMKQAGDKKNELKIVMGAGIVLNLSAEIFARFSTAYSSILLSTKEEDNETILRHVTEGEADLGLIGTTPAYIQGFRYCLIKKSDLHVCMHVDHPLAKKVSLTFQDLKDVPMVGFGEKYDLHRYYVQKCHENGFSPTFSIITAGVNISRNLVLENRSVSFAFPDYRKDTHPSPSKVKVLPLNLGETDDWGIYAITRKDEEITLAQQLFIEFMQSQARMESPATAAGVR